jgi:hypothetical protein
MTCVKCIIKLRYKEALYNKVQVHNQQNRNKITIIQLYKCSIYNKSYNDEYINTNLLVNDIIPRIRLELRAFFA